jgi:hypothetical protein
MSQVTVTQRISTPVYDRHNLTILTTLNISDPSATNYTPSDFFQVFDAALSLDTDSPSIDSIVFQFLLHITSILQGSEAYNFEALLFLRQFMAVPIMVYNDIFMGEWVYDNGSVLNNLDRNAAFAIPTYRVHTY